MKQWMNRLITLIGVLLIILAIYLFSKPYIDNYLHEKITIIKLKIMIKGKEQTKTSKSTPKIPSDKSKMAGYIEVPDAQIKEPVYPGPATPEQLNRGVSFAEGDESLNQQNISIAGHTFTDRPHYQFTNLKSAKSVVKCILKLEIKLESIK